jgi:demethylmacrocin O-methyltransferase
MLQLLRETAVRTIKPRVGDTVWQALRRLEPSRKRRGRRKASAQLAERDLPSVARHFTTDKWGAHRYAQHYEHHFGRLKNDEFALLEIGIGGYSRERAGGASLRMWKAFFPRAQIIGLDIHDKSFVEEPRIRPYRGSQTDEPLLRTIVDSVENLLVVVDDGSHRPEHVRETFRILFPLLPDGAMYAIEDTQTSYWPRYGGSLDLDDKSTTMGLVKSLVDGLNYEEWREDDYTPSYSDLNVVAVHCYHNLVIIEKGPNCEGTNRKPTRKDTAE